MRNRKDSGRCSRNSKGWPYKHIFGPFVKVYLVFSIQTFANHFFFNSSRFSDMSILNFASNPYFEDDDFALSTVPGTRMK